MELRERVFIITGAASGIGLELARALARAQARVALADRLADRLPLLVTELGGPERALALPVDLAAGGQARAMVEATAAHFGRLDGLINNAAIFAGGNLAQIDLQLVQTSWQVNVLSPLEAIQAAVPYLRQRGGVVANVSSKTAVLGLPHIGTYAVTKAAISILSETLRRELVDDGIRVLLVFPGVTETEVGKNALSGWEPRAASRPGDRLDPRARTAAAAAADIVAAIRRDRREMWGAAPLQRLALGAYDVVRFFTPSLLDRLVAKYVA